MILFVSWVGMIIFRFQLMLECRIVCCKKKKRELMREYRMRDWIDCSDEGNIVKVSCPLYIDPIPGIHDSSFA